MNKEIYEKNIEALRKKYPAWAAIFGAKVRKKRNFDVIAEESLMGDTILKVVQDGKPYYLNGKYAPSAVVERWLAQQGKMEEYTPIVVVGVGNGAHLKRIMEEAPKTSNILIYEPSPELFRRALQEVDLSFLFQKDIPVGIIVEDINGVEKDAFFHYFISVDNMSSLRYYLSGNYAKLFPEEVGEFVKRLHKHLNTIEVCWETTMRYTSINAKNTFHNLPYFYEGYNVEDLRGLLPPDIPAIIVSAGPSLNKNIMDLKKAVGKACIIATDTAMKPLLNAGIIPNMFVIVDGLKPAVLFEHKDLSKVPMVTMTAVSTDPMKMHKGKKFFYASGSMFENMILTELGEKHGCDRMLTDLVTAGSVATSAYSLACVMGAKNIILVGQDLAMTGNRTHADGTFQDKMDEIDADSGEYFEVDAADGGKVLTRGDFKLYLDWFEKCIREWKSITAIDATEGGALIHGSKIMTLKGAIRKYCKREYNVKWHIDRVPKIFSGDDREMVLRYFEDSDKKLQEVFKRAKSGLRDYERLEKHIKTSNQSEKELQKTLKRIKKANQYMEIDYMAETVTDSLKGLEYAMRPIIYQMHENQDAEFLDIAEQGKVMMYSIAVASEEIRGLVKETIVPYAKKERARLRAEKEKMNG